MEIGSKIKDLRISLKLNQQSFADKLGISRGSLAQIEINRNKPTIEIVTKIVSIFGLDSNYFFSDAAPKVREVEVSNSILELKHELELCRKDLERLEDAIKWKDEKISILEERLENYGNRDKSKAAG